jgi:predicted AlkP superfamily phosphohydrolase/phosphomutase
MLTEGASARLESEAAAMPESAWPTLMTGTGVGSHGFYNWRPVEPRTYQRTRQPPGTCRKPFWELLRDQVPDARAVILDAPFSAPIRDARVTELVGWGERGGVMHESWPPGLFDEVVARHGAYPRWTEDDYDRWPLEELRLVRALEDAIERRTDILIDLLRRRPWELGLACYYELHNGGHAFFRALHSDGHTRRARFRRHALLRLYKAADASLGRLRATIGDQGDMLVCSGKGFRPNTNGETVLPEVLERLGYQVPRPVSGGSRRIEVARAVVRAVAPRPVRRRIFGQLSPHERDRMIEKLWIESVDWARSRAIAESDLGSGFVRLNVRGREPEGVVAPGDEYEQVAAAITRDLEQLTHASSGLPAVERIYRREELAPGPNCDLLPDLIVTWTPHVMLDAVRHPKLGVIHERTRSLPTSEHTGAAFVIAAGPSFGHGVTASGHLADVAATALHLAGGALPHDMDGRPLRGLLAPTVPHERREPMDWSADPWALTPREHAT